jgi:hypothetical protein
MRDAKGRFVPLELRYKKGLVKTVEVRRGVERPRWITVIDAGKVTPKALMQVIRRREFESIPAAYEDVVKIKLAKRKKNKVMEAAIAIDKTRGVRKHLLRVTARARIKGRVKTKTFYQKINKRGESSYRLYRDIYEAFGQTVPYSYDEIGDIPEADDAFDLLDVEVERVI